MKITIKNNKNGCSGQKSKTYSSYEPNSYSVLKNGGKIGVICFIPQMFNNTGGWLATGENIYSIKRQYLRDIKAEVVLAWA